MESSPLWAIALLAILVGPFVAAIAYGVRHRDSGSPRDDMPNDAAEYAKIAHELRDVRNGGEGW